MRIDRVISEFIPDTKYFKIIKVKVLILVIDGFNLYETNKI